MRRPRRPNIFLIGFMASGKTSVGRILARRTGRPFLDTDAEISRAAGRSVARLFSERGEAAFRRLEERAVARAARLRGTVVAAGGGAVLRAGNVRRMRASGIVVYLSAPLDRLWSRARREGVSRRPLLGGGGRSAMERLLRVRRPMYRRAAHFSVRASDRPADVARRIMRKAA